MESECSFKEKLFEPDAEGLARIVSWASGLGFESMELWIASGEHLEKLAREDLSKVKHLCADQGVSVDYLTCDFTASWVLSKPVEFVKKYFDKIASFADAVGIYTIATISPPFPLTEAKWSSVYPGAPPTNVRLLPSFSWAKSWKRCVETVRSISRVLENRSLRLAVEPRPREILCNTDSVLRLFDEVPAENLGGVIDTSHLHIMREVPSVSIHKLGKKLLEFHASENDGITAYHWAPGQGEVDWLDVLKALKGVEYRGALCIDVTGMNMEKEALDGKIYIEGLMRRIGLLSNVRVAGKN